MENVILFEHTTQKISFKNYYKQSTSLEENEQCLRYYFTVT